MIVDLIEAEVAIMVIHVVMARIRPIAGREGRRMEGICIVISL